MATKNKDQLRPAVQQTQRDLVQQQRQKLIAAGDTPISIAKANNLPLEDLMGANPGVVTFRPGQTIAIPRQPLMPITSYEQAGVGNNSGYAMQGGGISTTNQYGVGVSNKSMFRQEGMGTQSGAFSGTGTNSVPKTSGGYMPSPSRNPFAGSGAGSGTNAGSVTNPPRLNLMQSISGVLSGQNMPGNMFYQAPTAYQTPSAAIQNSSGYVLQNSGVSTTNQYGVGITPQQRTSGGYMPSLVPQQNNPFAGSQAMVGVGAIGGGQPNLGNYTTSYNGFQTPTTNGFLAPTQATQKPPVTNQPAGYTNLTPSQAQNIPKSGMIGGDKQSALGTPAQQAVFPTDKDGKPLPYTGNPNDPNTELWKQYWNASARAGVDLAGRISTPKVMSRDQIWEMKAAQRRRQSSNQDGTTYDPGTFSYDTRDQVNPELVRNITWGI